jgi:hypothetical protein
LTPRPGSIDDWGVLGRQREQGALAAAAEASPAHPGFQLSRKIFPRLRLEDHVERSTTVGPPNRIFALRTVEQKKAFTQRPGSAL